MVLFLCFLQNRDRAASDRSVAILLTNTGLCVWLANLGGFSWPSDSLWTLKGVFLSSILTYPFLSWSPNPSPIKTCSPSNKSGFNQALYTEKKKTVVFSPFFCFLIFWVEKDSRLKEEGWRHHHQPWWPNLPCSNHCSRVGYSCHCWLWWCHGQGQERPGWYGMQGYLSKALKFEMYVINNLWREKYLIGIYKNLGITWDYHKAFWHIDKGLRWTKKADY